MTREIISIMKLANQYNLDPTPLEGSGCVMVSFPNSEPYFIKKIGHLVKAIEQKLNK